MTSPRNDKIHILCRQRSMRHRPKKVPPQQNRLKGAFSESKIPRKHRYKGKKGLLHLKKSKFSKYLTKKRCLEPQSSELTLAHSFCLQKLFLLQLVENYLFKKIIYLNSLNKYYLF